MTTKDSFDAFVSILHDKITGFAENANQPNVKIIQNELKDRFDDLVKSQGYVSNCLLYTSPSPRDATLSRMPSSA
mgnify:CR=1 FL=1